MDNTFAEMNQLSAQYRQRLSSLMVKFSDESASYFADNAGKEMDEKFVDTLDLCTNAETFLDNHKTVFSEKEFFDLKRKFPSVGYEIKARIGDWIGAQKTQIRGWIKSSLEVEKWDPVDEAYYFSSSVVDVFSYLFVYQRAYIERLKKLPAVARRATKGEYLLSISELVEDYVHGLLQDVGSTQDIIRQRSPPSPPQVSSPGVFRFLSSSSNNTEKKTPVNLDPETLEINELCIRISNLRNISTRLKELGVHFKKRWDMLQRDAPLQTEKPVQSNIFEQVVAFDASGAVNVLAHKIVYLDLDPAYFSDLYSREGSKSSAGKFHPVEENMLTDLTVLIEMVRRYLNKEDFHVVAGAIFSVFLEAYENIFVSSNRLFDLSDMPIIRKDMSDLQNLFIENGFLDVDHILDSSQAVRVQEILDYMEMEDKALIELYENRQDGESTSDTKYELILQVLAHRYSQKARKYAEYNGENILIKQPSKVHIPIVKVNSMKYILEVTVISAKGIKAMDGFMMGGKSDPYVKIHFGDQMQKTEVKRKNLNPEWNRRFHFGLTRTDSDPSHIKFVVWDWDMYDSDDFLGQCEIRLKDLKKYMRSDWVTLSDPNNLFEDELGKLLIALSIKKN